MKDKPVEERTKYFQEKLTELVKETEIQLVPSIAYGSSAVVAQITMIDLQNPEMLAKHGLKRVDDADKNAKSSEKPRLN